MKTVLIAAFVVMAGAVAAYLVSSLRNVARESIRKEDLPQAAFEITRWISDAGGIAYLMKDPATQRSVTVSGGPGKKTEEGFRPSHEYLDALRGKIQVQRITDKKTGQTLGYILASERLEVETGFNLLKRSVVVSIRDPEDAHHRRMREGP